METTPIQNTAYVPPTPEVKEPVENKERVAEPVQQTPAQPEKTNVNLMA